MKKTYKNPEMLIVKIASHTQMLAGSPKVGNTYNGETTLSREYDFFDED